MKLNIKNTFTQELPADSNIENSTRKEICRGEIRVEEKSSQRSRKEHPT